MRRETALALAAAGLGNLILAQDLAALNLALPSIERDLNVDLTTAQWVVNAYLLSYGMTIVTGGRLGDEIGQRRVFLTGAAIFAACSLLAGFAPHASWLIAARVLMGIGSGLMLPTVLAMGYSAVPREQAALAGGITVGAYGVGMVLGPIVGGALVESVGWRWIQFVNVPLAAAAILGVWRAIPADVASAARPRIDYAGIVTLSAALVALLFALDQGTAWGWTDWRILLGLAMSVVFLAVFVLVERRAGADALVPADIVRVRGVAVACALKFLFAPAYAAALLYLPQLMQKVLGSSPLEAGLGMIPMLGAYAVVSFLVGVFAGRLSARVGIIAGLAGVAAGPLLVSLADVAAGYAALVPGMVALGIGLGLFQPSVVTEAVKADDKGRKGLASGLVNMFQWVGGAIGLGVTTTIVAASERSAVDAQLAGLAIAPPRSSGTRSTGCSPARSRHRRCWRSSPRRTRSMC
jgi:EmrB/QacA subfamily drug resistance transporter